MAKYIDADALIERLKFKRDTDINRKKYSGLESAISQVSKQPTADVVEVVRCKECKHLYELSAIDRRFYCRHHPQGLTGINIIEDNPYCSYGERKCDNG